jgi:CBS-domain-containing membrane protein
MTHKPLPTFRVSDGTCIVQAQIPQKDPVTLDSPALAVVTDLTEVRAATAHPLVTLVDAEQTMMQQGVRLLFVVSEMPCVDGIVTLHDMHSDKPVRVTQERRVRREQLQVKDVMTPLSELDAVEYKSLADASVGNIVATLLKFGHPYLVVIEASTVESAARVRGLVSQSQVERQLGKPLPAVEIASTFAEIQRALR